MKGEVADVALNLLFKLAPSQLYFKKILDIQEIEQINIFKNESLYESMYSLYLASSMFVDNSNINKVSRIRCELSMETKEKWIMAFLSNGGFKWAINTLKSLKDKVKENGICVYLISLLNIIEQMIFSTIEKKFKEKHKFYEIESSIMISKGPSELFYTKKPKENNQSNIQVYDIEKINKRVLTQNSLQNLSYFCGMLHKNRELLFIKEEEFVSISDILIDLLSALLFTKVFLIYF